MSVTAVSPTPATTSVGTRQRATSRGVAVCTLLAAYLAIRMFYVVPSGLPQPWDMALALVFLGFLRPPYVVTILTRYRGYALLLAVIIAVNSAWGLYRWNPRYAFPVAFHVFNLLLLTTVATARLRYTATFDALMARAVAFAAVGQVAYCTLLEGKQFRAQGSFNNENQLGYWALCLMGTFLLCKRERNLRDLPVVACLVWIELISTSRAGVVAMGLLVALWAWDILVRSRHRYVYAAMLVLSLLVGSATSAFESYQDDLTVADHISNRFSKDSSVDEVGMRNTDRIAHYPGYALLGAGEGDLERFPHSLPIEIHSVPMTILFSYGILGTIAALWFLYVLIRELDWPSRVIVGCLALYSITHNGMRFAFCWILLGCIVAQAQLIRRHQRPMAPRIAALTNRTSNRSATSPRLPAR